ncbi:MAG TPA: riboflavin synthase [Actinomycetota bacterium]
MFTGIIEGQGEVVDLALAPEDAGARLRVRAPWLEGLRVGDSVAVNGCCLTVTALDPDGFSADVMAESLRRTALGRLGPGDRLNLERPLAVGDRLGGHMVQGHVDGLGRVLERRRLGQGPLGEASEELRLGLDPELARYVVAKGSITVNGVSLTVVEAGPDWLTVALIPHTMAVTNLGALRQGDEVHLEVDVLAKYVERLLEPRLGSRSGA